MAPGDACDLEAMLDFALTHEFPAAIRYAKAPAVTIEREPAPMELGVSEVMHWGRDAMLVACGAMLGTCLPVAEELRRQGIDAGVINARFVKPLDAGTILRAVAEVPVVVTVEEGVLAGGFGSAVLEAANDAGLDAGRVRRLGIPDRFVEHGERKELLADLGLDEAGILRTCLGEVRGRQYAVGSTQ
jgi:1-deoxy-D-xylulose-5-phosphate synthase